MNWKRFGWSTAPRTEQAEPKESAQACRVFWLTWLTCPRCHDDPSEQPCRICKNTGAVRVAVESPIGSLEPRELR